jgi:hypothetical protein
MYRFSDQRAPAWMHAEVDCEGFWRFARQAPGSIETNFARLDEADM